MSEDLKHPEEGQPSSGERKQHSGRSNTGVGRYLTILFLAAFLLLMLAYLMQMRASEATIGSLRESLSSFESLNDLILENQDLHDEIDRLEEELEQLEEQLDTASRKYTELEKSYLNAKASSETLTAELLSWQTFWDAEQLYTAEHFEECAEVVRSWGWSNDFTLPEAAAARAQEIFDALVDRKLIDEDDLVWSVFS